MTKFDITFSEHLDISKSMNHYSESTENSYFSGGNVIPIPPYFTRIPPLATDLVHLGASEMVPVETCDRLEKCIFCLWMNSLLRSVKKNIFIIDDFI